MDYNQAAEQFLSSVKKRGKAEIINRFNSYSHGEQLVLSYLYKQAGKQIVPSEIAKYTNTSTARVATILNNLEEKHMITREISRTDRRKILVAITDKGRRRAVEIKQEGCSKIARIFEEMGEEKTMDFIDNFQLFLEIALRHSQELENRGEKNN